MTKKDYKIIAECIGRSNTTQEVITNLIRELKLDNPLFNEIKFIDYIENKLWLKNNLPKE